MAPEQFVIGIGGVATVGKDTLYKLLKERLAARGITSTRVALADKLKEETRPIILKKYGIDIFNCTPKEKEIGRPILVEHALRKRTETKGRYWIEEAEKVIQTRSEQVIIIPDIRHEQYENDECSWIFSRGGMLIHLSRYDYDVDGNKFYIPPANEEEEENDPKVKTLADFAFEWRTRPEDVLSTYYGGFLDMVVSCTNAQLKKFNRRSTD